MTERRFACLSLTIIATVANCLAAAYVTGWCEFACIAHAANTTSYMFQLCLMLIDMRTRALKRRVRGYTRRVMEVNYDA